ncbi:hypothetical protein LWM68_10080 [Niabella sp. W65]|nr:hypothetical protein [Niabella sp. W65]MCH7363086.1 hypothetical protein [Niabella sp. W65]ULT39016.1 hypothetical protein KRR40_28760 [Niabella sp. I65]
MKYKSIKLVILFIVAFGAQLTAQDLFPDGTPIPDWFRKNELTDIKKLGKQYRITAHGVKMDSNLVQTQAIQSVIDKAAAAGGGVIIIPRGVFLSGNLFLNQARICTLKRPQP